MPPVPLPVLPGVYYARVHGTFEGLPSTNILSFKLTPAPGSLLEDSNNADIVATRIATNWVSFATSAYSTSYTAGEVTCYPLGSPTLPAAVATMSAAGGFSAPLIATSTAALISHKVIRRGRGSQGRTFITPLENSLITADGKSLTNTYQGLLQTAWDTFISTTISDIGAATGDAVLYGQVSKKGAGAFYPIVGSTVESTLSTQRRRARRRSP